MKKIMDIYGHSTTFSKKNPEKNNWYGRILVNEDHSFEGIVEGPTKEEYSLLLGQVTNLSIAFSRCIGNQIEEAYRYDGLKEGRKYIGTFETQDIYDEIPIGTCEITLLPAEITREESNFEKAAIENRISYMKRTLGDLGTTITEQFQIVRNDSKQYKK